MPQFFNLNAILSLSQALRNRQLLVPSLSCANVKHVPFADLKSKGYVGVIFDKDNTLTLPYSDELPERSKIALATCKETFGEQNVVVFSNHAGSSDDVGFTHAARLQKLFGVTFLKHGTKKPGGIESIKKYYNVDSCEKLVFIGDRYLTDIYVGEKRAVCGLIAHASGRKGNLNKMFTIYVEPLSRESEIRTVKLARRFEDWIVGKRR